MTQTILTAVLAVLVLGLSACSISPVIAEKGSDGGYAYNDCRRAARDVCRYRESGEDARKQCVAEATYQCVTGANP